MQSKKLKNTRVVKINKKRLKISLVVLDAVKSKFLQTQEFIDSTLKKIWKRKDDCRWGDFFASKLEKKKN